MPTKTQAPTTTSPSNRLIRRSNPESERSNITIAKSNPRFVSGLAELLGQFSPSELEAHRNGLIVLMNDVIDERHAPFGLLEPDTPLIVIQRVAGHLAGEQTSEYV